jgi:hypothetical protein
VQQRPRRTYIKVQIDVCRPLFIFTLKFFVNKFSQTKTQKEYAMNLRPLIFSLFALLLMNCSAKVDTPNIGFTPAPTPQKDTSYPEFLFQDIQGTVYGQDWLIQTGVVKPFGTGGQKIIEL